MSDVHASVATRRGASLPTKLFVTAGFATLAVGGLAVMQASQAAKSKPVKYAGTAAGLAFLAYGFYYSASIGLLTLLGAGKTKR